MSIYNHIADKATGSAFYRWVLNSALRRVVPFNASHGVKIEQISKGDVKTSMPYKRSNLNHLRSIHACALATLCEFTSGIGLMTYLSDHKYRIVLKSLHMDYHYRAKSDIFCNYQITEEEFNSVVRQPLENAGKSDIICKTTITDSSGNLICTGTAEWQIKNWDQVKSARN